MFRRELTFNEVHSLSFFLSPTESISSGPPLFFARLHALELEVFQLTILIMSLRFAFSASGLVSQSPGSACFFFFLLEFRQHPPDVFYVSFPFGVITARSLPSSGSNTVFTSSPLLSSQHPIFGGASKNALVPPGSRAKSLHPPFLVLYIPPPCFLLRVFLFPADLFLFFPPPRTPVPSRR